MTQPMSPGAAALTVYVEGIGLLGPGLPNWEQGRQYLNGSLPYVAARCVLPMPMALPAAERRRAGAVIKASLAVGQEAVTASGLQANALASVFSSSSGDGVNCHEICSALASDDRLISPTRFHNSVHNASSGYWSISSAAMASASVLCAHDASFAAGLLEAMTQCVVDASPVLLVVYDTDYPEPLHNKRPIPDTMGVALVLSPRLGARSLARITLAEAGYLRQSIPVARALPLLQAIAKEQAGPMVLGYLDEVQLALEVTPC
jgi:hypothetical protein